MKSFLTNVFYIFLLSLFLSDTAFAQLYRNSEYQFSIEIPDYMEYRTPRGPNVKMSAYAKDFTPNIVIIVKPSSEISFSNDEILMALLLDEEEKLESSTRKLKFADIVSISSHEVLYTIWNETYIRSNVIIPVSIYSFEFITNNKYYYISYTVKRGTETTYERMISQSIFSFVDETDWY